jgi:hypothetical protein
MTLTPETESRKSIFSVLSRLLPGVNIMITIFENVQQKNWQFSEKPMA